MRVDIEATGYALGLLFAVTLVQLGKGVVPAALSGVVRLRGEKKFSVNVIPEGDLDRALRLSANPEVQEAAWLAVMEADDQQLITMHLCAIPIADPPFSAIVVVTFDDDNDTLYVSKPNMMVPQGADDTVPDQLWSAINRGMSSHDELRDADIVFGDRHFQDR
jgi:hypothetical protein